MKKMKLAVIGTGHWGPNLVRNFDSDPRVELAKICDLDLGRAKEVASRFRNLTATNSVDEICQDASIDAVVICTPTDTHYPIAKKCLQSGKHLFIEKPMAMTSGQCQELIEMAKSKNLRLFIGHVFLYHPAVQYIKNLITAGDLGDIVYIYGKRVNLGPVRRDVDALWDLAPHDIAIYNYWLDSQPLTAAASGIQYINPPLHDVVFGTLKYPGKVFVNLHVSWIDPRKSRQIVVVGTKKMVIFDDMESVGQVQIYDKAVTRESNKDTVADTIQAFKVVLQDGDLVIPKIPAQEPLRNECHKFIECLTSGKDPISDGANGVAVVQVLEALSKSLANSGAEMPIRGEAEKTDNVVKLRRVAQAR